MRPSRQGWAELAFPLVLLVLLFCVVQLTTAQQDAPCNALEPCKSGCCSSKGKCGFGPEFCKEGCQGTCNATSECGQYALPGQFDCPLNVCCSKHGYCGFDSDFCNSECQNKDKSQCGPVPREECSENTDAMSADVRIAYYGAWTAERSCDAMQPENIPAGVLTHINVAFEFVSEDHEITDEVGHIVGRVSRLKNIYPGLRVNIALGGWVFNDPPTQTRFSDMSSTRENRRKFILSLIRYMKKYALDGVDLDWEYPVADDRGGIPADYKNFVSLCDEIKATFNLIDPGWELTLTLPASYWYLKGFDVKALEDTVDWFNVMTYDIHGLWDQHNIWTGPFLKGHTNLTEIEDGLDLLWRNGVSPDKVVMGFGFYGRGFTMSDTQCSTPPNCLFDGPSFAGDCTNEPGILSYNEVLSKEGELGGKVSYDEASSVKWMVYGSNQWISYDDAESFQRKVKYMFSRCLRGLMIWELGLDTANNDALIGLFGEDAVTAGKRDTSLNPAERERLAFDLSAFTGQNCYLPKSCTDGENESDDSKCAAGYSTVAVGHSLTQDNYLNYTICEQGEFRRVCCPTKAKPKNCEWVGESGGLGLLFGCRRGCGDSQFELQTDYWKDPYGNDACLFGQRSLCCDSTDVLDKCKWTSDCDWTSDDNGLCKSGETEVARRFDQDNGERCKVQTGMGNGGNQGPITHENFRSFCCPKDDELEDCKWANDPDYFRGKWDGDFWKCPDNPKDDDRCTDVGKCWVNECFAGSVKVTSALVPPTILELAEKPNFAGCASGWDEETRESNKVSLCCAPPSRFTKDWPVNPAWLWADAFDDEDDDVTWEWANNFGNNHADKTPNNLEEDPGDDPYGFVMLDGPPGSIAKSFSTQFTVVTESEPVNVVARSFVTTNQTQLDATFDHAEEDLLVYCNYPHDSHHCNEVFYKGAVDTIIKLPNHVGEGPWARVVSMEKEHQPAELPSWAIKKRQLAGHDRHGLYRLKIDYSFNLIKREDGPVNMRVDYTNLQDYWDDVTDEAPSNGKHRRSDDPFQSTMSYNDWRSRVDKAKVASYATDHDEFDFAAKGKATFRKRDAPPASFGSKNGVQMERRWWGKFVAWLEKITTLTKEGAGNLPMGLSKVFNIYSGRLQCVNPSGVTFNAGLDITADVRLQMGTRYAYYFSGTVVPPHIIDTYVFLGAQPSIYAGIDISGNAELSYTSEVKKLISTITYPGLSIKGIATVGPSLDLLGQIYGKVTVAGNMKVGAKYTMDPIEMYMPNDDQTRQKASNKIDFSKDAGLQPVFEAGVRASVGLELRVTPRINCGIRVGGDIGPSKEPLVLAQVAVYMNTTLYFEAYATAETNGRTSNWEYGFKVELWWRVVLDADAQLYLYGSWKSDEFVVIDWQTVPIWDYVAKSSPSGSRARALDGGSWLASEEALPNPIFGKAYISVPTYQSPDVKALESMEGFPNGTHRSFGSHGLHDHAKFHKRKALEVLLNETKVSTLVSRAEKGEENEFMLGDFKCTTGPSACDSPIIHERALDPFRPRSWLPTTKELERRATADCPARIPRLFYNCIGNLADTRLVGPNGAVTVPGICTSVRRYLTNHGINNDQYFLNFEPSFRAKRNREVCGGNRNPCKGDTGDNARWKTTLGGDWNTDSKNIIGSCDEFPFASTEEGGAGYDGTLGSGNALGATATCAGIPQQNLQGNCNGLMNLIETDVDYFNDRQNPNPGRSTWYKWDENDWTRVPGMTRNLPQGGTARQRWARYTSDQPFKINSNKQEDRSLSWHHRRNFTLFLLNNRLGGQANFPDEAFSSGRIPGGAVTTVNDQAWIMCAVSLRGQSRFRFTRDYNGFCWDGTSQEQTFSFANPNGNQPVYRNVYFSCKIDFAGSPFNGRSRKRQEPIGYFGGEPVYGVSPSKDTKTIIVDVPIDQTLADARQAFPLTYED